MSIGEYESTTERAHGKTFPSLYIWGAIRKKNPVFKSRNDPAKLKNNVHKSISRIATMDIFDIF